MSINKLKENVYSIGVQNPELKVFDIIMKTEAGTTYNSYLIDDDKVAVIDSVKEGYFDEYLSNIKSVIGDKKVDYIVTQHTELDHSGTIKKLIKIYPEAVVVGSKAAIIYNKEIINSEFKFQYTDEDIDLGHHTLKFISAPNLHWPDTIFTYVPQKEVLFTCDFLGCHYCPKNGDIFHDRSEQYFKEMKYYFDVIMGPFKKFVISGLAKIEGLTFDIIAPSHGPVHSHDLDTYINLYKEWATTRIANKNVQIFYVSAYGNTEAMANYIADLLKNKNIKAEAHEITSMKLQEAVELIENASGILIGSPTINQDAVKPAWDLLSLVNPIINRNKVAGAFGSYGWSGEGVPMLTERLKSLKFKVVADGLRFKFVPSESDFKIAQEFVDKFLEIL